jgi:hypothetical protein
VAVTDADAIGGAVREWLGAVEIWATKAPRTMARQETTKASFQPVDLETLKWIVFWVWVVMAFSGSAFGVRKPLVRMEAVAPPM